MTAPNMSGFIKKMPWASHEKPQEHEEQQAEDGESLTTILTTAEQRTNLTILIADCTDAMRQAIVDIFDAKQTGQKSDMVANLTGDQALMNPDLDPGKVDVIGERM